MHPSPQTPDNPEKQWRKYLALSVGIHLLVLLVGMFAPSLLHFQRRMPEVYTVNLFNVSDINMPAAAPGAPPAPSKPAVAPKAEPKPEPKPEAKPEPQPEVKPEVKTTPVKPTPQPEPTPAPKDAISLKPIKTKTKTDEDKVKKLRDSLLAENKKEQTKAEVEKAKAEAEKAEAAAEKAREAAEKSAREAVSSLKQILRTQSVGTGTAASGSGAGSGPGTAAGSGPGGGGMIVDENLRRYLLAVHDQIQSHWLLPDMQNWKANVEALVVIRVKRDGTVLDRYFEKKSDNPYFNQFVEKTIKESSPLPPFPVGLTETEMEIGLKFKPGEVL